MKYDEAFREFISLVKNVRGDFYGYEYEEQETSMMLIFGKNIAGTTHTTLSKLKFQFHPTSFPTLKRMIYDYLPESNLELAEILEELRIVENRKIRLEALNFK